MENLIPWLQVANLLITACSRIKELFDSIKKKKRNKKSN